MVSKLDAYFAPTDWALKVRALRQDVIAGNIANQDTPGYKARDFDFAEALNGMLYGYRQAESPEGQHLARTHGQHLDLPQPAHRERSGIDLLYRNDIQPSLDGNTVDMNVEMANFADTALRYQASLTFMQHEISQLRNAILPQ